MIDETISYDMFMDCIKMYSGNLDHYLNIIKTNPGLFNKFVGIERRIIEIHNKRFHSLLTEVLIYYGKFAEIISTNFYRFEQFNEKLSEITGFKIKIDQWTASAIQQAVFVNYVDMHKHHNEFYNHIKVIPVEITDPKRFTLVILEAAR